MIFYSSRCSLSTGSAAYIAVDASCTRSARPGVGTGVYRIVQFTVQLHVSLNPLVKLCPPEPQHTNFRALHVQTCRRDYSAEGEGSIGHDETLVRALRRPESSSTAPHFFGSGALTVPFPGVSSAGSVSSL
jgi:hypothetical protein